MISIFVRIALCRNSFTMENWLISSIKLEYKLRFCQLCSDLNLTFCLHNSGSRSVCAFEPIYTSKSQPMPMYQFSLNYLLERLGRIELGEFSWKPNLRFSTQIEDLLAPKHRRFIPSKSLTLTCVCVFFFRFSFVASER